MRPPPEPKKLLKPLVPEVIADEGKSTALVQVGRSAAVLATGVQTKDRFRDVKQREGFEFYIALGDRRTLDQVAKKVKVPLSLVEIWRKEYFWDIKLPLCIRFGSVEAAENEIVKYVKLGIAEFFIPAPPGTVPVVPAKKRLIDLGQGQTVTLPENLVINQAKASPKKAAEFMAILRDAQRSAIERQEKLTEILGEKETPEDDPGKGPKNLIQVAVTIIKS